MSKKEAKAAATLAAMQQPVTAENIGKYLKPIKYGGSVKAMPKIAANDDFLKDLQDRKKMKMEKRKKQNEKKQSKKKQE